MRGQIQISELETRDVDLMKLTDILDESSIVAELHTSTKTETLDVLVEAMAESHPEVDKDEILNILLEREELGSTGIGDGIAIPHAKSPDLPKIISGFGLSKSGIDFDSLDGKPAHLFFLLVAPVNSPGDHLKVLARISRMLKNAEFRNKLLQANSQQDIYQIISQEDAKY